MGHNQLFRIREDSAPAGGRGALALRDAASNFSIEVLLSVDVSPDAGVALCCWCCSVLLVLLCVAGVAGVALYCWCCSVLLVLLCVAGVALCC